MGRWAPSEWTAGRTPHRYVAQGLANDMLSGQRVLYLARNQADAAAVLNFVWHYVRQARRAAACVVRSSRGEARIRYDRGGEVVFGAYHSLDRYRGTQFDSVVLQCLPEHLSKRDLEALRLVGPVEFLGRPLA